MKGGQHGNYEVNNKTTLGNGLIVNHQEDKWKLRSSTACDKIDSLPTTCSFCTTMYCSDWIVVI